MTIDELIVKLSLDPSNFTKGQKEAVASFKKTKDDAAGAAKSMQDSGQKGSEFFGALQKGALGLFAVLVGGNLEKFIANTVTGMSALGRSAQIMGESTQDVQAFALAMERAGGSREAAIAQLQKISQLQQDFKYGKASGDYAQAANLAGIQATDSDLVLLEKFAAYAEKNRKDPKRVRQIGGALGLDDVTIAMAMKGAKNFRDEIQKSKDMGLISDEEIAKLQKLNADFKELAQSITLAGKHLVADMAGPLSEMIERTETALNRAYDANQVLRDPAAREAYEKRYPHRSLFFDTINDDVQPMGATRGGSSGGVAMVGMGQYTEDYFRRRGWKANAAAGFAGFGYAESKLNPLALSEKDKNGFQAHGIFQLRGQGPGTELYEFRKRYGRNPEDMPSGMTMQQNIDQQLEFMHIRATGVYRRFGNSMQRSGNTHEAAWLGINQYEKPGSGAAGDLVRADYYQSMRRKGQDFAVVGDKTVHIGAINITVPNGDPQTIARGVGGALRTHLAQQANGGPH